MADQGGRPVVTQVPDEPVIEGRRGASKGDVGRFLLRIAPYSAIIVWALAILIFSIANPDVFATTGNFRAILSDQAILVIVAVGLIAPLIAGQFDLSIGANMTLSGLITAGVMAHWGLPWGLAFLIGIAIGITIGAVNGLLVAYGGVHSFIATLGVGTLLTGFTLWYGKGQIIFEGVSPGFVEVGQNQVAGVQLPVFYAAGVSILVWLVLRYTPFGRYLYAIGGNRRATEVAGVRVKRHIVMALVLCGFCAALAGVLLTSRTASAQSSSGEAFLLPAFAVAFIGAATFKRGQFNVPGTIIGVYFLATLVAGAFIVGATNYVAPLIQGAALLLAVLGNRALIRSTT